jgi:predicted RNase H-like HicB family nuclease
MLTEYVDKAMRKATYELIEDGTYFGFIPEFQGVWGNAPTLEACRDDLKGALEGWLILGLWDNDEDLPVLGKLDIVPRRFAKARMKHGPAAAPRSRKAS